MEADKFKGVWTALITPFQKDGSIDWEAFEKLIEKQFSGFLNRDNSNNIGVELEFANICPVISI